MTNAELLAKIKAEIERLKGICTAQIKANPGQTFPFIMEMTGYDKLLSFLSTLESEKPMNQDEALNEEIKKEMVKLPFFIRGKDQIAFARHFAQWGAEHAKNSDEKPVPNDLEEAAWDCVLDSVDVNNPVLLPKYKELLTYLFIAGAKWQKQHDAELIEIAYNDGITIGMTKQKEQMMKEAVDMTLCNLSLGNHTEKVLAFGNRFPNGKTIRIIIVKED